MYRFLVLVVNFRTAHIVNIKKKNKPLIVKKKDKSLKTKLKKILKFKKKIKFCKVYGI